MSQYLEVLLRKMTVVANSMTFKFHSVGLKEPVVDYSEELDFEMEMDVFSFI